MAYNERSKDLNDKPITLRWLAERPDAAARFERVLNKLCFHYTGNNQGYIDKPQYRFNDKYTGGYVIVVAQVSRVLVIFEPGTLNRRRFEVHPETFDVDVENLLHDLAACKPRHFDWSKSIVKADTHENEDTSPPDEVQMRAIKTRRGQEKFRKLLLKAYEKKCAITGCEIVELLEAAHIKPHAEKPNYAVTNGLLLRADLHTLFDLGMIALNAQLQVELAPALLPSEYRKLEGKKITHPQLIAEMPSAEALEQRYRDFQIGHYI